MVSPESNQEPADIDRARDHLTYARKAVAFRRKKSLVQFVQAATTEYLAAYAEERDKGSSQHWPGQLRAQEDRLRTDGFRTGEAVPHPTQKRLITGGTAMLLSGITIANSEIFAEYNAPLPVKVLEFLTYAVSARVSIKGAEYALSSKEPDYKRSIFDEMQTIQRTSDDDDIHAVVDIVYRENTAVENAGRHNLRFSRRRNVLALGIAAGLMLSAEASVDSGEESAPPPATIEYVLPEGVQATGPNG